jgi:DUF971 family protein
VKISEKTAPVLNARKRGDTTHSKPLTGKKSLLKIVESSKDEEIRLESIWSVGNYALGVKWGDGHSTGIYTYDNLFTIASTENLN